MDTERETILQNNTRYDAIDSNPLHHHLKGTMQWLVEEKEDICELVYVINVDRTKISHNNVIVFKSDKSYERVHISNIKSTQDMDQNDAWKLQKALVFAEEQSRYNAIVPGSLLVEEYDKIDKTTSCFPCFGTKEYDTKKALRGFKVQNYKWEQSQLKEFETELMSDDSHKLHFKSISDTTIVINENDPLSRKVRQQQRTIDERNGIIAQKGQMVEELRRNNAELKQQIQCAQSKVEKQRRNSVHQVQSLEKTIQDSEENAGLLRNELKAVNEKLQISYNEHHKLQKIYNENKKELKIVTKQKNALQDRLIDYNPNVTTLDANFPPIQDIVTKFDQIRGQTRLNCAKQIKKYFKSKHKDMHKLQISKKTNESLFNVLMMCYNRMKDYHRSILSEYKQSTQVHNEDNFNKTCYYKMRKEFETLFKKIETEYVQNILEDIHLKYDGVLDYCTSESWVKYVEECLYICWYVAMCQSPQLQLYPVKCDRDVSDDRKSNDESFKFNNDKFVAIKGSEEEEEYLNYFVWPAIIRVDKNYQLSKIHALFLNHMPMYSKKAMKRREAQAVTSDAQ